MCEENRECLFILLAALLFSCAAGALRGEERESWYLIAESEVRSIEKYKAASEAEKRTWLLQVQNLKAQALDLQRDSAALNSQLAQAREANRKLEQSFSALEAGWLTRLSSKNGEIAVLKQEAEAHKRTAGVRLSIIIAIAGTGIVFTVFAVCRVFKIF